MNLPFDLDRTYLFYGANCLQFKLDDTVYEAVEDPDDGYRSYLDSVQVSNQQVVGVFFRQPLDTVLVCPFKEDRAEGFLFISTIDGHIWLRVGTDWDGYDYYYPTFVFEYTPRT